MLKISLSHFDLLIWVYKSWTHFWGEFGELTYGWTHRAGFPQRVLQVLAVKLPQQLQTLDGGGVFRPLAME